MQIHTLTFFLKCMRQVYVEQGRTEEDIENRLKLDRVALRKFIRHHNTTVSLTEYSDKVRLHINRPIGDVHPLKENADIIEAMTALFNHTTNKALLEFGQFHNIPFRMSYPRLISDHGNRIIEILARYPFLKNLYRGALLNYSNRLKSNPDVNIIAGANVALDLYYVLYKRYKSHDNENSITEEMIRKTWFDFATCLMISESWNENGPTYKALYISNRVMRTLAHMNYNGVLIQV